MRTRKGENDDSWVPDVLSWKYALLKIVTVGSGHYCMSFNYVLAGVHWTLADTYGPYHSVLYGILCTDVAVCTYSGRTYVRSTSIVYDTYEVNILG